MRTVFFDIDTQLDFVSPSGALYAHGAERILHNVVVLNRYAAATGTTVISTMDAHAEADPEFQVWPGHCVAGTLGQRKVEVTLLPDRLRVPSVPMELPPVAPAQILLEKQNLDCFSNPNLRHLLRALNAERYVVYGVVTEYCVQIAAFGLLDTGRPVEVVVDAIANLRDEAAAAVLAEFEMRGGQLVRTVAVLGR